MVSVEEIWSYLQSSLIGRIIFFGTALFIVLATLLWYFQNSMLYIPEPQGMFKSPSQNPRRYRSPGERDFDYEDVVLTTTDGIKIRGWLILHPAAKDVPTIVFFHENAGNIGSRLDFAQLLIQQLKCNFLIVAYRGYSDSDGTPTEDGLKLDAFAIMEYATGEASKFINPKNLIVMGRSLGGAVATYILSTGKFQVKGAILENTFTSISEMVDKIFPYVSFVKQMLLNNHWKFQVKGAILENTFTSISEMVDKIFPYVSFVKQMLLNNHWKSIDLISKINCPMMFIVATMDELVPPIMSKKLYAKATGAAKKEMIEIEGATHNGSYLTDPDLYCKKISAFMKGL